MHYIRFNKQTFIFLTVGLLVLLAIPLGAIGMGWSWIPQTTHPDAVRALYFVSQSAGLPALIIFCAIVAWHYRDNFRYSVFLIVSIALITIGGMAFKSTAKDYLQEPRPYVVWLENNNYISTQQFYTLPNKSQFIQDQALPQTQVPAWLQTYWSSNTGYSFPSGHSFFATEWVLIIIALLWRKKAYFTIAATTLWGIAVLISRLYLGMHWPWDIIPSCFLAFLLVGTACLFWEKWSFAATTTANTPLPSFNNPQQTI